MMEHAAFEPPLSDDQLKDLGRLAVNCGFAEFLLNFHAGMFFHLSGTARMDLVAPLTTRRKIEIIESRIGKIPKSETRKLVEDALKLISPTIRARNYMLHGIWGFDGKAPDAKAVVVSPKEDKGHRRAAEIAEHADNLAIATRMLAEAMVTDHGHAYSQDPERLVIELT